MKAEHAKRAAILVAALNEIPGARKDLKREKPKTTANKRMARIQFRDSGYYLKEPEVSYWLEVDIPTMRLILDASEKIVRDELTNMGVEIGP